MYQFRKAEFKDAHLLSEISCTTFIDTYSDQNTESDILFFTENYFNANQIAIELHDKSLAYFIMYHDSEIAGYLKLRFHSDAKIEVARFYLTKKFIGSGAAQQLLTYLIQYAQENNFNSLELSVWKENPRAIRFYEKSGFKITGETTFDWGTGKIDNDWTMSNQLDNEKIR